MAVTDQLFARLDGLRKYAGSLAWGPLVSVSRSSVLSVLKRIETGQLTVVDNTDAERTQCGKIQEKGQGPVVELSVLKEAFWVRVLLFADMGFAESYMLGEISCSDLTGFFELFILNRSQLSNGTTLTSSLSSSIAGLARRTNTLANSRLNVSAHYDLGNEMFAAFLSPDMTYSCPIWLPKAHPDSSSESLEHAQETKLNYIIEQARIKPTDHVLEIGTGWGSFAIAAVRKTGCRVTSITLSVEQKELAEKLISDAGYTENIEVLLCDYRALPMPREGPYDKIVSIEMLEAVGKEFLSTYFECVDRLLKPQGGIAVFQCITIPETRYEAYQRTKDFINTYIFPGGHLPSVTALVEAIHSGSKGSLVMDNLSNIGYHYARTLHCWRDSFMSNFESRIRPALLEEHQGMTEGDVRLFRRKWEYYYCYCEAAFRTGTLGDVIMTLGREGSLEIGENVRL